MTNNLPFWSNNSSLYSCITMKCLPQSAALVS
jgi:hypothetical protein